MQTLTQFAASDIFSALGIDWKMLVFQVIGFVILVWLMAKFVYPPLLKTIDERQDKIEASSEAAQAAEEKATKASAEIAKLLAEARKDAVEIVATAKDEATAQAAENDAKSKAEAERIVAAAQDTISKEVLAAKKMLHNETIELVALATEKVVGKAVSASVDNGIIKTALEESK